MIELAVARTLGGRSSAVMKEKIARFVCFGSLIFILKPETETSVFNSLATPSKNKEKIAPVHLC